MGRGRRFGMFAAGALAVGLVAAACAPPPPPPPPPNGWVVRDLPACSEWLLSGLKNKEIQITLTGASGGMGTGGSRGGSGGRISWRGVVPHTAGATNLSMRLYVGCEGQSARQDLGGVGGNHGGGNGADGFEGTPAGGGGGGATALIWAEGWHSTDTAFVAPGGGGGGGNACGGANGGNAGFGISAQGTRAQDGLAGSTGPPCPGARAAGGGQSGDNGARGGAGYAGGQNGTNGWVFAAESHGGGFGGGGGGAGHNAGGGGGGYGNATTGAGGGRGRCRLLHPVVVCELLRRRHRNLDRVSRWRFRPISSAQPIGIQKIRDL